MGGSRPGTAAAHCHARFGCVSILGLMVSSGTLGLPKTDTGAKTDTPYRTNRAAWRGADAGGARPGAGGARPGAGGARPGAGGARPGAGGARPGAGGARPGAGGARPGAG